MSTNYRVYLESFKEYDPSSLQENSTFPNLANYSTFISNKANEIFSIASADSSVDSMQLQREINELGVVYVKLFSAMKQRKMNIK